MMGNHPQVPPAVLPPPDCYEISASNESEQIESSTRESESYLKAIEIGSIEAARLARQSTYEHSATRLTSKAGFPLEHISQVLSRKLNHNWLIEGLLTQESLAQIFGEPGTAKSFLAIDLAFSIATGTEWHDHKTTQAPVVFLAGEGQSGLAKRFEALATHRGISLEHAPLFVSSIPAALDSHDATQEVYAAIQSSCVDQNPGLIVIDTMARNMGNSDENSLKDMSAFIQRTKPLAR